jgi:hypothetical protein
MQHLLRKQIILVVAFLGITMGALSQTDEVFQPNHDDLPYYLGMSMGMSNSFLSFKRGSSFLDNSSGKVSLIQPTQTFYLNLGLTGTLKLREHILLRANPTLLISGSREAFTFTNINYSDKSYTIPSVIVDLPIAFKIQSDRYNAFRFTDIMRHYVLAGVKLGMDLGSEKSASVGRTTTANLLRGTDFAYELGFGVSYYLRYATISPEIKFSYGFRDLNKSSATTPPTSTNLSLSNIDKITSNFVYFTLHIEN